MNDADRSPLTTRIVNCLREARQFVSDGGCDEDDAEVQQRHTELLEEIDWLIMCL
jgi:hypothetical protein